MLHFKTIYYRDLCQLNNSTENKKKKKDEYFSRMVDFSKNNYLKAKQEYQNIKNKEVFSVPTHIISGNNPINDNKNSCISLYFNKKEEIEIKEKHLKLMQKQIEELQFESYQLLLDIQDYKKEEQVNSIKN